ncbi:MAG: Ni/Fe hydrogenase subunit alpha [Nitrospirae bacterium]|nr:Ni/Fe hydrogenase subunit alpha [Nitrospirota bacterium]
MKETLISRVEGHGRIEVKVRKGELQSIKLNILTPPRLFEKLIVGRHFSEVPTIVSRICSICSASHRVVSVMALENAFGIKVPEVVKLLRRLLLHGETLESHALHLFILALPDYYRKASFVELAKDAPDLVSLGFRLKGLGNRIQETVGGRAIHQITPVVGGMSAMPPPGELESIAREAEALIEKTCVTLKDLPELELTPLAQVENWVSLSGKEYEYTGGDILINGKERLKVEDFSMRFHESSLPPSYVKHTLLDNKKTFMVGAFARVLNNTSKLKGRAGALCKDLGLARQRSTFMNNPAQAVELVFCLERVSEIIEKLLKTHAWSEDGVVVDFTPGAGTGVAAIEAPRGLLLHRYSLDERGYVLDGDIVTPTALNLSEMERTLRNMAQHLLEEGIRELTPSLEMLVRAFDPCISCSVHLLEV